MTDMTNTETVVTPELMAEYLALKAKIEGGADSAPVLTKNGLIDALDVSNQVNVSDYRDFSSGNKGFTVGMRIIIDGRMFIGTLNLIDDTKRISREAPAANGANPANAAQRRNSAVSSHHS